jgi:hypothetical protein
LISTVEKVAVPVAVSALKVAVPENAGAVEKTARPVPVSSVRAERRLALEGVAKKVATLAPRPDTPVLIGRPVASIRLKAGVASVPPRESETPPKDTDELASIELLIAPLSTVQVVPLQVKEPKSAEARLLGLIALAVIS